MKYHDTGEKDLGHALAHWFEEVLDDNVAELRVQSGYFRLEAVRIMASALQKAKIFDLLTIFVIGSNDGDTTHQEAAQLMTLLGMPRDNAKLGFVSFGNYLFHPKVYHITRKDGSQAAFIGSANFTPAGVAGWNVEAALSLDSTKGDSEDVLSQIALAVDKWFVSPVLEGISVVQIIADLAPLLSSGILSTERPSRVSRKSSVGSSVKESARPNRRKLIILPPWPDLPSSTVILDEDDVDSDSEDFLSTPSEGTVTPAPAPAPAPAPTSLPNTVRGGFPSYFIFAPSATTPTVGVEALSGTPLDGGAVGLILKLNKDSARRFARGEGTANISIPIATVGTFRFGIYGKHSRPRAEITLHIRYVGDNLIIDGGEAKSNVMGYGFARGESGHADIRMLMPTAVLGLEEETNIQGLALPAVHDVFLLEWPTSESPVFRLTFLVKGSELSNTAQALFSAAEANHQLVGGACWLPPGFSPEWVIHSF